MELRIPEELLKWIDSQRGASSRQAFIVRCMFKVKEVSDVVKVK